MTSYVILAFILVGWACQAQAATLGPQGARPSALASLTKVASPSGSGSTCSVVSPCSLATVASQATAGDVVFLRGGTYDFTVPILFSNSGSASAFITIESYPGETVIIDGSSLPEGTAYEITLSGSYIAFRRFAITNMPKTGLVITGTHNLIDGLWVHHNKHTGIYVYDSTYTVPYGALGSYNTIRHTTVNDNSDAVLGDGGNADGISIASGIGNQILYCLAEHNSDDGFDTWRSQDTRIAYSIAVNNGIDAGNGNGFKAGGPAPSSGTTLDHNLSYNNRTYGFKANGGANVRFDSNTAWDNDGAGFYLCDGSAECLGNNAAVENISLGNSADVAGTGEQTDNSWNRGGTPAFISATYSSSNFLRPTDAGGYADIGAYQTYYRPVYMPRLPRE